MDRRRSKSAVKPNLLVIGAMKASTTLFCRLLAQHPKVWFPAEKELRYFSSPSYGTPGSWEAYLKLFRDCPPDRRVIAEGSTDYTKVPWCGPTPQRIRKGLGQPKLIYLLRDPVARAISHYKHFYSMGRWRRGITLDEMIVKVPSLVGASRYMQQIRAYHDEFGEGSIHIILADELHAAPARVLEKVVRYLGIDFYEGWWGPLSVVNSSEDIKALSALYRLLGVAPTKTLLRLMPASARTIVKRWLGAVVLKAWEPPPITVETKRCILELVADDLQELRGLLGNCLDCWPSVQTLERESSPRQEPAESH
jgi:hypothetical protein